MKRSLLLVMLVVALIAGLATTGCSSNKEVSEPLAQVIKDDSRNAGIGMTAAYGDSKAILVLDMQSIDMEKSPADVFRVVLQYAKKMKDKQFDRVELACKGNLKFHFQGSHFKTLGVEYGTQNPIYTMRTFPQNLTRANGKRAFPVWEGGILGVAGKQMEDFKKFHMEWYVNDLLKAK